MNNRLVTILTLAQLLVDGDPTLAKPYYRPDSANQANIFQVEGKGLYVVMFDGSFIAPSSSGGGLEQSYVGVTDNVIQYASLSGGTVNTDFTTALSSYLHTLAAAHPLAKFVVFDLVIGAQMNVSNSGDSIRWDVSVGMIGGSDTQHSVSDFYGPINGANYNNVIVAKLTGIQIPLASGSVVGATTSAILGTVTTGSASISNVVITAHVRYIES